MAEKAAFVVQSGALDKLYPMALLATGAAAIGMEVHLFLTFGGLMAFKKDHITANRLVSDDSADCREPLLAAVESGKLPSWYQTLQEARQIGDIHIVACGMAMDLFGLEMEDLVPEVEDIMGVTAFMAMAKDAQVSMSF